MRGCRKQCNVFKEIEEIHEQGPNFKGEEYLNKHKFFLQLYGEYME
jgi:hypothetical protein